MTAAWWHSAWAYVWDNVLPPSAWTLVGIGLSHWHLTRRQDAHHADLKQHVTERTSG